MRTRSRSTPKSLTRLVTNTQAWWGWSGTQWVFDHETDYYYTPGTVYPWSFYERTTDELHKGPPYRTGGPFDNLKLTDVYHRSLPEFGPISERVSASKIVLTGEPVLTYSPWKINPSNIDDKIVEMRDYLDSRVGVLDSVAGEGYNRYSPVKPRVDLGQTIAEMREIPRMLYNSAKTYAKLWRSSGGYRSKFGPKTVADEWLNTQFGWRPFLSTIYKTFTTVSNLDTYIKRLRKYNGKWEKRGGRLCNISDRQALTPSGVSLKIIYDSRFSIKPTYKLQRNIKHKAWFQAEYKYWIPELNSPRCPWRTIRHMFGLDITPALVWELIPWSWLIDWFVNVGNILESADEQRFGQLVSRDGYAMATTELADDLEYEIHYSGIYKGLIKRQIGVTSFPLIRKKRIKATPFGFGVHSTDLSPWKVSILAALGISKMF